MTAAEAALWGSLLLLAWWTGRGMYRRAGKRFRRLLGTER